METTNTEHWEFVLPEFAERPDNDKAPNFVGECQVGASYYDAACWLGKIKQGRNTGDEYLHLTLDSKGGVNQKASIPLWQKKNRKAASDPHFKNREELAGRQLNFSAWVEPAGQLYQVRVAIEPFAVNASDMSESALESHQLIADFVNKAALQLPGGERQKLSDARAPAKEPVAVSSGRGRTPDPDLDDEPSDLPF